MQPIAFLPAPSCDPGGPRPGARRCWAAPEGVMVRQIDERHMLYLNVSGEPKSIRLKDPSRSVVYDREYGGEIPIAPYEPDFVELK